MVIGDELLNLTEKYKKALVKSTKNEDKTTNYKQNNDNGNDC